MKVVAGFIIGVILCQFVQFSCKDYTIAKSCTLNTPYKSFTVMQ